MSPIWRDVDFAGSTIRVRASYAGGQLTTPKSGKVRAVPMAPDVGSALARLGQRKHWTQDDDLVSLGRPEATSTGRLWRAVTRRHSRERVCARSGSTTCGKPVIEPYVVSSNR